MQRLFAFMAVFVLGLAVSVEAPNPLLAIDHALRQFSAFVQQSLSSLRAAPEPIDAKAAAKLDEDLDWRMAKTPEGLRAFLVKYPNSAHAPETQAALAKVEPPLPPSPAPKFSPVVEVENEPGPRMGMAPDLFAALDHEWKPPETKIEVQTVTRWRSPPPREHVVTHWLRERPRYHRRSSPWPFFAWGGPRDPRDLRNWQLR